jgi:hypothetical protein
MHCVDYLLKVWRHRGRLYHVSDDIRSTFQKKQGCSGRPLVRLCDNS